MKTVMELLNANERVSGWKINVHQKESYELFFVKGKLETLRCTDTCDKEVTLYVDHGEYKGEAQFFVYPSTTSEQLKELINEAVAKALLINNQTYQLPEADTGNFAVDSNFADYAPADLAAAIAKDVFDAAKAGDAVAQEILEKFYDYMGQFLGSLCSAVDPEVVVLGGGVSKAGQMLLDGVEEAFHKYVFHAASGAKFALASLFNDAGAYGAFKLALDAFGK
mgnify:CR=1 FL=1